MFKKILVANRGEIALRAMRECRELGIASVAVYSDADAEALFVKHADEAISLGDPEPAGSYLNVEKILDAAKKTGTEAIYPGYGFLAENPGFVEQCENLGIEFIGPPSKSMNAAKPKHRARDLMKSKGIPVAPGSDGAIEGKADMAKAFEIADNIGYPVIVKPSGAGGGIGMKVAETKDDLAGAMEYATSLGSEAFGVPAFYLEKFIARGKHIEFQILADKKGNTVYVSDRECSVQRRYQKLIEEAPSPIMTPELRARMGGTAVEIAKILNYVNALTVEFMYSLDDNEYYFNECNTRLQVEHPLTEYLTGINLVKEQIRIAAGEDLGYTQDDIKLNGWSIECRINAEDPFMNFMPAPGKIEAYDPPGGFGVRVDGGVYSGYAIPFYYDSLMAKLLSWGRTRDEAIETMKRALKEYHIEGVKTNIPFHIVALDNESFRAGDYTTNFVDEQKISKTLRQLKKDGVFA
ncbi:MAG: acetyl-CoA carboxylase biotin carboxylase subunit [Dehalococcoidia bacterium]|nr:MAG: acetyl-CoA carboxylase biotin carboxylase subunit [Dehalococcoidia bacterium]